MSKRNIIWLLMAFFFIADLAAAVHKGKKEVVLSEQSLRDKVKGAWAGQTLGCSYGGPTEFKFLGTIIQDYIHFLKAQKDLQENTVIRYMKVVKKITNMALANDWMEKDPFIDIRFHEQEVHKEFLTKEELETMKNKVFDVPRLDLVRDIFLFQCFTGLAFIDVSELKAEHLVSDNQGNLWIRKARQKTKVMCNIPLLDIPLAILEKYEGHPLAKKKGTLLPVPCNQKLNSYLKEIADLCGIKKNLTTHTGRHTFSTVVALANNVSLENVAKMLGHTNTKMTQRYAKVLDQSILRDMQNVRENFSTKTI